MASETTKERADYDWWDRLCAIQPHSFFIVDGGVRKVEDSTGAWIDRAAAQVVMDDAQAEINELRTRCEKIDKALTIYVDAFALMLAGIKS